MAARCFPAVNMLCWGTDRQIVVPLANQSGEALREAYRRHWLRPYGRPRVLVVDQQLSICTGHFAERAEAYGTRLEVIPTESPWRNGKTERAGKEWKEDYYRTTLDSPPSVSWADFEEERDAVNFARGAKPRARGYSTLQRALGKTPAQAEDPVLECGGADLGVVSRQMGGDEALERSLQLRRKAMEAACALDHERRWTRALAHATRRYPGEFFTGQPVWFWRKGASAAKRPTGDESTAS